MESVKIESVTECTIHIIETNDGTYERYGIDSWMKRIGESSESVYYCEELEYQFHLHLKSRGL